MLKLSSLLVALFITNQSAFAASFNSLKAHRAVYDVKLLKAEDRSGIKQMNGRIVYELNGNACEGMSVQFRFVANIVANGDSFTTDQRTSNHESANGTEFTFNTNSYVNDVQDQKITGNATRLDDGLQVTLGRSEKKEIELNNAIFPTAQLLEVIKAAKEGTNFVKHDLYDGSGNADNIYNSVSVIGRSKLVEEILENEDKVAAQPLLSQETWPVTMSYFKKTTSRSSEAVPLYEASFYLYEDGVTRQLQMRYPDYVLSGNLSSLEYFDQEPCEQSD